MLEKLRALTLENADILEVTHENGTFYPHRLEKNYPEDVTLDAGQPFYRLLIEAHPGPGSAIRIEVWLPESWNGIYVGSGSGGLGGTMSYEGIAGLVKRGYAAAYTEMGTFRGRPHGSGNPDMWKDYGWRATHVMTVLAKQIIAAHYGRPQDYAYFVGGSKGGHQGIMEAQRFPEDHDGIVSEVHAQNIAHGLIYLLWNYRHLYREGKPLFTAEESKLLTETGEKYLRSRFGADENGLVLWPWQDESTVTDYLVYLKDACPAFTEEQLAALKAVYEGPTDSRTGRRLASGMPIASENFGCGFDIYRGEEAPMVDPFPWVFGADYDTNTFDFGKDADTFLAALGPELSANNCDLTAFAAHGGKLIANCGTTDPIVTYAEICRYHERMMEKMGGYENTQNFCRFFPLPGKDHGCWGHGISCAFGDDALTLDMLDTLRLWREEGKAPDYLVGAHLADISDLRDGSSAVFTHKIYPYGSAQNPVKPHPPVTDDEYLER